MPKMLFSLQMRIYAIVLMALALACFLTFTLLNRSIDNAFEIRKSDVRSITEVAVSALQDLDQKVKAGEMSLEEAQAQGRNELEKLNYGNGGYFFAVNHDHFFVAHRVSPHLVGTNQHGLTDKAGQFLVQNIVNIGKSEGAGFVTYLWPRPNSQEIDNKLSFVMNFAPWNWVIGTGAYIEDIQEEFSSMRNGAIITLAAGLFLMSFASYLLMRTITKPLDRLSKRMQSMAGGDLDSSVPEREARSEFGTMSYAIEQFRQGLLKQKELEATHQETEEARNKVIAALSDALSKLSKGNLTNSLEDPFPSEFEQLRKDFNATLSTMESIVNQLMDTASSIRNGATEISQSADDLSNRTESQAATLEETAAALDELTASVRSAADGARNVETTMQEAGREAEASGEVVQNAVTAMTEIETSSNQISQIISVIDDIAFQTNLLALNAGVEAARAGEAGRGFAVVASEVRALAQRSSDAAMEIKTLISDSSQQVERGVDLVGKAGDALNAIVGQIGHISSLISGIAEGAAEQSTGLGEINTGMTQLDQVTQQNAAMVEQSTAASHLLKSDAGKMMELISHFDTGVSTPMSTLAPTHTPAAPAPSAHGDWDISDAPQPTRAAANGDIWQEF
ncbi:methyl-accepting chemotaxis protein [Epibacterium ulvae]|uniref:methyl-accepting chemotaxis protein n=1 Tax=Epibacterium ulvae TaxID=1156985 RepID=UPI0024918C5C|nr:methyl-accepting chemotaxis protein [Epibacterium ulvae]